MNDIHIVYEGRSEEGLGESFEDCLTSSARSSAETRAQTSSVRPQGDYMKKITFLLLLALLPLAAHAEKKDLRRVVVVAVDQMRPDYIDRYNLPHLKALRAEALEMQNASTGNFPSITIISHAAIGTSLFPKHFGWTNEILRDDAGLLGEKGKWHDTTAFSYEQYQKVLRANVTQPTALKQLKQALDKKLVVVGQKDYAALTFGGVDADHIITLKKHSDGEFKGKCIPAGKNLPSSISKKTGRFWLDCSSKYGTENELYELDSRFVPGNDPEHLGGDIWTADAALEMMRSEKDWGIMLVAMASVDRIGHIYGEMDHQEITSKIKSPYNLEKILRIADEQVGRLIQELKNQGL